MLQCLLLLSLLMFRTAEVLWIHFRYSLSCYLVYVVEKHAGYLVFWLLIEWHVSIAVCWLTFWTISGSVLIASTCSAKCSHWCRRSFGTSITSVVSLEVWPSSRIISSTSLKASTVTSSAVVVVTVSSAILVSIILVCLSVVVVASVVISSSVARVLSTLHALMRWLCYLHWCYACRHYAFYGLGHSRVSWCV